MITKIEYYLPERILTNDMLATEFTNFTAAKIEKKVGIRQRHLAADDETALDLAVKACEKVLNGYDRSKIDFLLLCTQSPDYFLPGSSSILQDRLGLPTSIGAFDYNLGCSGFIYGLAIAKGLMASGTASCILLVTSETYSHYLRPDDKGSRSIFGDAAAAVILERKSNFEVGDFSLGTDGKGAANLIVENGGIRALCKQQGHLPPYLYMNGPEIFNFTIEAVPETVNKALARNRLTLAEINHFVFHQANQYMLEYLRDKMGIDEKRFHIELDDTGNTVSSSIPILLKKLMEKKTFHTRDKILLTGFGVGYSYGSVILSYNETTEK